ncbi:MAG: hypothetical protein HY286_04645 [Planctomycetes bacterium]|nr:hypothetical protein [Planctomycetota bacterium]
MIPQHVVVSIESTWLSIVTTNWMNFSQKPVVVQPGQNTAYFGHSLAASSKCNIDSSSDAIASGRWPSVAADQAR